MMKQRRGEGKIILSSILIIFIFWHLKKKEQRWIKFIKRVVVSEVGGGGRI